MIVFRPPKLTILICLGGGLTLSPYLLLHKYFFVCFLIIYFLSSGISLLGTINDTRGNLQG